MIATTMSTSDPIFTKLKAYEAVIAARRRAFTIGLLVFAVCVLFAGWMSEVDLGLFIQNIHKFPTYIGKIFTLDSGDYAGRFVLLDVSSWYWGINKWLRLLIDTLLIAYVATLLGATGGFTLSFLRGIEPRCLTMAHVHSPPVSRVLPHGAGTGVCLDLRAGLWPWPHGGCAGDCRSHAGCAGQAVLRSA